MMNVSLTRSLNLLGVLSVCLGCQLSVRGSGHVETEERTVRDFDRVVVEGEGTLLLEQGDDERLVIEAEDNLLDELTSDVHDDTLELTQRRNVSLRPTKPIIYHLQMRDIRAVRLRGSGNLRADEIETPDLELDIEGSGSMDVEELVAERLDAQIDGSGDIQLGGEVDWQRVRIFGSGEYSGFGLRSEECIVDIEGSGRVEVHVTDELEVDIEGSGDVRYEGDPSVTTDIDGSGDVRSR